MLTLITHTINRWGKKAVVGREWPGLIFSDANKVLCLIVAHSTNHEKRVAILTTNSKLHQSVIEGVAGKHGVVAQAQFLEDASAVGANGVNA